MILRIIPALLLLGSVLPAQEQSQAPTLKRVAGRHQAVLVYQLDVMPRATLIMKGLQYDVLLKGTGLQQIVIEEKIIVSMKDRELEPEIIETMKGRLLSASAREPVYIFEEGNWPRRYFRLYHKEYSVRLPKMFNLIVQSYGDDIELEGLQGDLEIKSGGGDLRVSSTEGKLVARTGGGDVDLTRVAGQIDVTSGGGDLDLRRVSGKISCATGGGDIDIWTGQGHFELVTGGGDITLKSLEGGSSKVDVSARTGGGDIHLVSIQANTKLKTGGGDISADEIFGQIEATTGGGDLDLRHIKGDATAYTGHGDITIGKVGGAVQVNSHRGDIHIDGMTLERPQRQESSITTSHGDVRITLTTRMPVSIEAQVLLERHYRRDIKDLIHSNLELVYERDEEILTATYSDAHPEHHIKIRTDEGRISIIKEKN